jgi:hypothetical protein
MVSSRNYRRTGTNRRSSGVDRARAGVDSSHPLDYGVTLVDQAVHDDQRFAASTRRPGEKAVGTKALRSVLCCATRRGDDYD